MNTCKLDLTDCNLYLSGSSGKAAQTLELVCGFINAAISVIHLPVVAKMSVNHARLAANVHQT